MEVVKAIIGKGGEAIKQLREQSGMFVHIDDNKIPPGPPSDLTEQVVCLSGALMGVQVALQTIAQHIAQYRTFGWFPTWANNSFAGCQIEGLSLFEDIKGKGKGKKCKDELQSQRGNGGGPSGGGFVAGVDLASIASQRAQAPANMGGQMTMKLLVSQEEASTISGSDIGQATSTNVTLSSQSELYPGTNLQELRITAQDEENVLEAVVFAVSQIAQVMGHVNGGMEDVPSGQARLKLVVPMEVVKAIIGKGGEAIKQLREQSGMYVHIDDTKIPPGPPSDLTEQVVCLSGSLMGVQVALPAIAHQVAQYRRFGWFPAWANNSFAGCQIEGLSLFEDIKGKGKGKKFKVPEDAGRQPDFACFNVGGDTFVWGRNGRSRSPRGGRARSGDRL